MCSYPLVRVQYITFPLTSSFRDLLFYPCFPICYITSLLFQYPVAYIYSHILYFVSSISPSLSPPSATSCSPPGPAPTIIYRTSHRQRQDRCFHSYLDRTTACRKVHWFAFLPPLPCLDTWHHPPSSCIERPQTRKCKRHGRFLLLPKQRSFCLPPPKPVH